MKTIISIIVPTVIRKDRNMGKGGGRGVGRKGARRGGGGGGVDASKKMKLGACHKEDGMVNQTKILTR